MEGVLEKLTDFSSPSFDVTLLDNVVQAFYTSADGNERMAAQNILTKFQEHPDAWQRVDAILEHSQNSTTKFYGLQILESMIKYRWKALPEQQRDGIKNYVVNLLIKLSSDDATLRAEKVYIGKLNLILVQVLKHEWPHRWTSFIPDFIGASKTNESLCENNMRVLTLLSEEIFDFSLGEMTQAKIKGLKESLNREFGLIYELCEYIMANSSKPALLEATLQCLLRFLSWIPLGYIFETNLIEMLCNKFLPEPVFRNDVLSCLAEISALKVGPTYDAQFVAMFTTSLQHLTNAIPTTTDMRNAYHNGDDSDEKFVQNLALYLTSFLRQHVDLLERAPETHNALGGALQYLVRISEVEEVEVFKTCLDYWNALASDLYHTECQASALSAPGLALGSSGSDSQQSRRALYAQTLSDVRLVLISRMARPEEVIIVEDENGEIVKETMKDTDAITLYKAMRETLVYLTHLDVDDTERIMLNKLDRQMNHSEWSWHNLNTLCWAIGSISGAMSEDHEKRFLVTVIKDLLHLCEIKRGKDNKAVVAANIMYVVGQYPRFLRAHWKFLKTVVKKLFEFMHEMHPGVRDMACDTFLKISLKCRRKFVTQQVGETMPFIDQIIIELPETINDLEPSHIHSFFESVGYMIGSHPDAQRRSELVIKLMKLPNGSWDEILEKASSDPSSLLQTETMKRLVNVLRTNARLATALGPSYSVQLGTLYLNMLNLYRHFSEQISQTITTHGEAFSRSSNVKSMRAVKREVLRVLEAYVERCDDPKAFMANFVPPLLDPVLGDYARSVPGARDPEVLSMLAAIIAKLRDEITSEVPRILDAVFECTLNMITKNFEDFPDHRLNFFTLLKAINNHAFRAFFMIPADSFKLVIDSIVWAFKHTERNVADTGLTILHDMLRNIASSEVAPPFYQTFYLRILQDVFYVLTDTLHKPGFKMQCMILAHLFMVVEQNSVGAPLNAENPSMDNRTFLREYLASMLTNAFPNVAPQRLQQVVVHMMESCTDITTFKNHVRDFLVHLKEFSAGDNTDLFDEEAAAAANAKAEQERQHIAIPGMVGPHDPRLQTDGGDMNE